MLTVLRRHITYANVMATIAVFVAFGGSSYAAIKLSKGQVKSVNLAANAVVSAKVKDGSLLAKDFGAGQLPAGAQGSKGDAGPAGAKGEQGAPGKGLATLADTVGGAGEVPLDAVYRTVAATTAAEAPSNTSGAWYGPVTIPSTNSIVLAQAHVRLATLGVDTCRLETRVNDQAYQTNAAASSSASSVEIQLSDSFPAFTVGAKLSFRVQCAGAPNELRRANIGVVLIDRGA